MPAETNYILPALGINLCNGDSVFGLPEEITINFLASNHRADIVKLHEYWQSYTNNPMQPELVDEIEKVKQRLRDELNNEFRKYMDTKQLSQALTESKPFHWALEFWHFFFDINGNPLPEDERGADVVLGNPPYERIQVLKKKSPAYVNYLDKAGFCSTTRNYDLAVIFIEKGVKLLKKMGEFGYIVTNKFIQADYGEGIRKFLSENQLVRELIDFGDQKVFEDATTYTALLFLRKVKNSTFTYVLIKKLEKTLDQLERIRAKESTDEKSEKIFSIVMNRLEKTPWILMNETELTVAFKTGTELLHNIKRRIFQGLVTGADPVFILVLKEKANGLAKVYSHSMNKEYTLEVELIRPLLKGQNIKRWQVKGYDEVVLF
ncbi:MAG: Eco57I restriction-modification methylase domain-containing protein, partial [Candidatus Bathyarchaeia archaeon]